MIIYKCDNILFDSFKLLHVSDNHNMVMCRYCIFPMNVTVVTRRLWRPHVFSTESTSFKQLKI